jgi:ATP-binding cassette subfamily C (CFTR/MRP) protein 1
MIHDGLNRWLSVRMEGIGTLIIFTTAVLSVLMPPTLAGVGFVGVVLMYAANVTPLLNFGVRQVSEKRDINEGCRWLEDVRLFSKAPGERTSCFLRGTKRAHRTWS